jgi:hypothetical protein
MCGYPDDSYCTRPASKKRACGAPTAHFAPLKGKRTAKVLIPRQGRTKTSKISMNGAGIDVAISHTARGERSDFLNAAS